MNVSLVVGNVLRHPKVETTEKLGLHSPGTRPRSIFRLILALSRRWAMNVQTSIVIDRPIEKVWAYLDDHSHELEWRSPSLKRLDQVSQGPTGVGTRYEGVIGLGPGRYPYVNELTRYEPPNRVSWKAISSSGWVIGSSGSYVLARENGHTRLTHEIDLQPNNFGGTLLMPLVGALGSRSVMPMLLKLKAAVEASM